MVNYPVLVSDLNENKILYLKEHLTKPGRKDVQTELTNYSTSKYLQSIHIILQNGHTFKDNALILLQVGRHITPA